MLLLYEGAPGFKVSHRMGMPDGESQEERRRGFYSFSQPTRLYRCARVVSDLVKTHQY